MSAAVEEVRLSLPHIELAAHLFGPEDGLPVIALHGWLDNANSFARLAPRLRGLRIVALDMAGHGHSGHRPLGASYALWDYVYDVLQVAEQLGWKRFGLLGHSLGAIVSLVLAGSLPERVSHLALIDGVIPPTATGENAAERMGMALQAQLDLREKRKPVYATLDRAIEVRMKGMVAVSREAAELLAQRGLMPVPGGYTWRSDSRLTLASPLRLTQEQAMTFVQRLSCPTHLVVAADGMLAKHPELLERLPFSREQLPGGHHLHLNDEAGASLVADCFNRFFAVS
ncbi:MULTISPECIES: alpha/beta hydrolase [Pseudomonas]|uniref:Hydrolase, alpha/beta fold family n=3 Tax=Pseudomonas chlororaphis TaxID=587753 RepID=A0A3G7IWH1_9PSED|nr:MULTISPECIES: alpha/beta hydrolase [Pseudomonas]AZD28478.1 Hydrolase, alpha/beta fold family [Pseudomonas chlororaphis]AZD78338.1 Hydrolase, alpha/beta fold family [Pseudomonas chlororaphis subsp. aurantiaca]AZE10061.1 Hydrolase, alpha/beta fold family [Pseudomonas chlororaphis subsp. aureofaciens]AZE16184.1 Hydrolase, alpha/beta fold family [Pseudomonas chlororaphis subsp. aureofaciens]AZE22224.1 Hydrolase, alpha/beta fold family [Pseudomonas chlororaphis subsp. aureofaciens]